MTQDSILQALTAGFPDPDFNEGKSQYIYLPSLTTIATSLLPLPDETVLVAARRSSSTVFYITRLLGDGSVATDFGNEEGLNGQRYLKDDFGNSIDPYLHAGANGRFYVLGFRGRQVFMARFSGDGLPDNSFGPDGGHHRSIEVPDQPVPFEVEGPLSSVFDGERFYTGLTARLSTGDTVAVVLCITPAGELDLSFNGTGLVMVHVPDTITRHSQLVNLGVQRHGANAGKLLIVGSWQGEGQDVAAFMVRYTVAGEVDHSFADQGFRWLAADQYRYLQLVVDPSDSLKLCGSLTDREQTPHTREVVFAWHADGAVDLAFNGGRALLETVPLQAIGPDVRGPVLFQSSEQPSGYQMTCVKQSSGTLQRIARLTAAGEMDRDYGSAGRGQITLTTGMTSPGVSSLFDNGKLIFAKDYHAFRYLS